MRISIRKLKVLFVFSLLVQEIQLQTPHNASKITEWSRQVIRKQYEWDLINVTADNKIDTSFGFKQSIVVYTVSIYG